MFFLTSGLWVVLLRSLRNEGAIHQGEDVKHGIVSSNRKAVPIRWSGLKDT